MKIGAAVPCLNEFRFLPAVLGQLLKVCDRVVLLRSLRTFSGAPAQPRDLPPLDPRVEVLHLWALEHEARNAGMEILGDCDFVFHVDSDEIFTDAALKQLRELGERGHRAVACRARTYWKSISFEIEPPDYIPVPVIAARGVQFKHLRALNCEPHIVPEYLMHHLSYVRTDDEVKEKLRTYGHAHQMNAERWFDEVWKRWDREPSLTRLHPIHAHAFGEARLVKHAIFAEIEAVLKEYNCT